jgi:predicted nucleic acid-binding Zn ribbon protein
VHDQDTVSSPTVIAAHELAASALATVLRRAPMTPEKVALVWRMSVGTAIVQATRKIALRKGVLYVTARDAAWRNEVERSAALIRRRVNDLLGEPLVRELRVGLE